MKKVFVLFLFLILLLPVLVIAGEKEYLVILNIKTLIYHAPDCMWARRCTKSCVPVLLEEALKNQARPCKVCGGKHNILSD